ncbi:MAG: C10 family peptidase [Treponema sp.]|jgi:hypothetical protein|nr:C10 family peptidase [Treponema sp.]
MKTRSDWKLTFTLFTVVFISTCSFWPDFPLETKSKETYEKTSERDFLSVLKATGNFTISENELKEQIFLFLNPPESQGRNALKSEKIVITGSKKLPISGQIIANRSSYARSAENIESPVDVYIFDTENAGTGSAGYVIGSNDLRIGSILAVVEGGTLEDEDENFSDIVFSGIANYIDYTIEMFDSISEEEIRQLYEVTYLDPESFAKRELVTTNELIIEFSYDDPKGPLGVGRKGLIHAFEPNAPNVFKAISVWDEGYETRIPVSWDQTSPYNKYINEVLGGSGANYFTGCGPTAMSMLMAYHKKPAYSKVLYPGHIYNWGNMIKADINNQESPEWDDIAILMYENYYYSNSNAKKDGTFTTESNLVSGLRKMGYTTPKEFCGYNLAKIRNSIMSDKPVIMIGYPDEIKVLWMKFPYGTGHFWIIDGIRVMSYVEHLLDLRCFNWVRRDFVHCNVGWGGDKNAWYFSKIFDFRGNSGEGEALTRSTKKDRYYRYQLKILPNVY